MSMNRKFLILYASFGAGHRRAAYAIREGLLIGNPAAEVDILDYFRFTNTTIYNLAHKTYQQSLRIAPGLWGKFYHKTSHISGNSRLNKILNKIGRKSFINYLHLTAPHAVITTYPVPSGVLSEIKDQGLLSTMPVITAITDFGIHSQWLHPNTDLYLVGSQAMQENLMARGVPANKVFVSGIPVSPVFDEELNKYAVCKKFALTAAVPTVLIMGGVYGVIEELKNTCVRLANEPTDLQLLVVCGRNAKMYDELRDTIQYTRNVVKIFSFVDNVEELMTVSNLIVTKAGGLTVSEALTKQLPMVIFQPLPGQEDENTRYLEASGAALTVRKDADCLTNTILSLVKNPPQLAKMSVAASKIRQANSAVRAAQRISELLNETGAIVV